MLIVEFNGYKRMGNFIQEGKILSPLHKCFSSQICFALLLSSSRPSTITSPFLNRDLPHLFSLSRQSPSPPSTELLTSPSRLHFDQSPSPLFSALWLNEQHHQHHLNWFENRSPHPLTFSVSLLVATCFACVFLNAILLLIGHLQNRFLLDRGHHLSLIWVFIFSIAHSTTTTCDTHLIDKQHQKSLPHLLWLAWSCSCSAPSASSVKASLLPVGAFLHQRGHHFSSSCLYRPYLLWLLLLGSGLCSVGEAAFLSPASISSGRLFPSILS